MLTRKDMFSRVEQLVENDRDVQEIIRDAELAFWERARAEAWLGWDSGDNLDRIPPPCAAGYDYLAAVFPAYAKCCARLAHSAAELEKYIDACLRELTCRVFEHKVLNYVQSPNGASARAKQRFAQGVRNRLAEFLANLRAQAWALAPACSTLFAGPAKASGAEAREWPCMAESADRESKPAACSPPNSGPGITGADAVSGSTRSRIAVPSAARMKRRRTVGSPEAVAAVDTYRNLKVMDLTEFSIQAQVTERTLRRFFAVGQMQRSNFKTMAASMGLTAEQLLRGELPESIQRRQPR